MNETTVKDVPEGYQPVPEGLGFTDNLQPLYRRMEGDYPSFGLVVERRHGNLMGLCHGGVLMTLADVCSAAAIHAKRGVWTGTPTVNLTLDFVSAARLGQWIETDVQLVSIKRRFGFSSGVISNSEGVVARFNGVFYLPEHSGMIKPGAPAAEQPPWSQN